MLRYARFGTPHNLGKINAHFQGNRVSVTR